MEVKSNEKKYIFTFPGIGIDYRKVIKGTSLPFNNKFTEYCCLVKEKYNIDLWGYLKEEKVANPVLTSWCAIYTVDCLLYQLLIEQGIKPQYMTGYSMGLITALTCANSISYLDGIYILKLIRDISDSQSDETMVAFIGWQYDTLQSFVSKYNYEDRVDIACENNSYCFVLSGDLKAVEDLSRIAESEGIYRVCPLDVDAAFHTKRFRNCVDGLDDYLMNINVNKPELPLLSVVDQKSICSAKDVKEEITRNLYSKMKWNDCVQTLQSKGEFEKCDFIEVSLGDMLTKVSRVINSKDSFYNYSTYISRRNRNKQLVNNRNVFCFEGINDYTDVFLRDIVKKYNKEFDYYIKMASDALFIDVWKIFKEAMELERGQATNFNKLLITFICNCVVFDEYRFNSISPDMMLCYSSGLNVALVCGNYLSFEDGIKILSCINRCFEYAKQNLNQEMLLEVGLNIVQVEDIIEKSCKDKVSVCCENSEYCCLLAGEKDEIQIFEDIAWQKGAISIKKMNMSFAFHYSKNKEWMKKILSELNQIEIHEGYVPIYSIYSNRILKNSAEVRNEIIINTFKRMEWRLALSTLIEEGYTQFWDISIYGSIKKMMRMVKEGINCHTFKEIRR